MPHRFLRRGALLAAVGALAVSLAAPALAADPARAEHGKGDPRQEIAHKLDVPVEAVRPSVVAGLFEVAHGGEVLYVTADGRYALNGDLFETDGGKNLTAKRRTEARFEALQSVSDDDGIVFSPKAPRYSITVFTDVDCGYCRKLHSQIAEYNRLGVRVRYVFYPRTGPGTESWRKAEAVWCSANRQDALTRAKQGADFASAPACKKTPVAKTYELGQELGIRGTPGIFTDRGEYLPGYYPPDQLIERLKQLEAGGAG